jgi:L-alanine-DL-glutamate epimerase-like enolase superfamily enzyme
MAAGSPPDVRKGLLKVPEAPGLGLEIAPDF